MKPKKQTNSPSVTLVSVHNEIQEVKNAMATMVTKDLLYTEIHSLRDEMATKEGLHKLTAIVVKNSTDIDEIKVSIQDTQKNVGLILNQMDGFINKITVFERRMYFHDFRIHELDEKTDGHGKRLDVLEGKTPA